MTTETKPVTDEEADGLRRVDKARTQGEWWWATANSIRELKAGPAYDPETVAYAYDSHDDGTPDISIRLVDMEAIVAAVNALPRLLYSLRASRAALRSALPILCEAAEQRPMYGGFHGGDPRDFTPDPECSTEEERAKHAADCARWNRGEATEPEPDSHSLYTEGEMVLHVARAGYGLGTTMLRDEKAEKALAEAQRALLSPSRGETKETP